MADDDLSQNMAALALTNKSVNFPLPREIRDQIYGYLLHHDKVHGPAKYIEPPYRQDAEGPDTNHRDESIAHTYRFNTNVMLVNKTISAEAKQELYSFNRFVIVSYQWPDLSSMLHAFDIPIVTQDKTAVSRFSQHSMRLHLRSRDYTKAIAKMYPVPVGCFIIMLEDLPRFCQAVRWNNIIHPSAGRLLVKEANAAMHDILRFPRISTTSCRLSIQFRQTMYNPIPTSFERTLAEAIIGLRIAGMEVVENVPVGGYKMSSQVSWQLATDPYKRASWSVP